jgi:hypothetical protein
VKVASLTAPKVKLLIFSTSGPVLLTIEDISILVVVCYFCLLASFCCDETTHVQNWCGGDDQGTNVVGYVGILQSLWKWSGPVVAM